MSRPVGGCLSRIFLLFLVVGALYAAWRWDPVVFPQVREWLGMERPADANGVAASPELASETALRLEELLRERGGGSLSLGAAEVSSVLRYSVPEMLPPGVSDPRVGISDGEVLLEVRVAREVFPNLPDLDQVLQMLPDTVTVGLGAAVMPFRNGASALLVRRVEVAGVPLPRRFHARILEAMGRVDEPGLPPEAILIPLPDGLGAVYVEGDSLILVSEP